MSETLLPVDPVVSSLVLFTHAPNLDRRQSLNPATAHYLGRVISERCGLQLPITENDLPSIAKYAALSGVPRNELDTWGSNHGLTDAIGEGIDAADSESLHHAEALLGSIPLTKGKEALQVTSLLAQHIYGDERRKAGSLYLEHPLRVAAVVLFALEAVHPLIHISPDEFEQLKQSAVCVAIAHDFEEKLQPAGRRLDVGRPFDCYSALSLYQVLALTNNVFSERALNTLRLSANFAKKETWSLTYAQYIAQGLHELLFIIFKLADIIDNRYYEPKPTDEQNHTSVLDNLDKAYEYDAALDRLWHAALQRAALADQQTWLLPYYYKVGQVTREHMPELMKELEKYVGMALTRRPNVQRRARTA